MIQVTDAKLLGGYRPWVKLWDSSTREVDLADLISNDLHPIIAALQEPVVFAALCVSMNTIAWDYGFDFAAENLRAHLNSMNLPRLESGD